MIIFLSPAKTLDFSCAMPEVAISYPRFEQKAAELATELKKLNAGSIARLMDISPKLAQLNFERFQQWNSPHSLEARRPAVLAYKGDVYEGLQAEHMTAANLEYAQKHLRILSGLYGILRPLDLIQPYRLEMGTAFSYGKAKDLYEFWHEAILEAVKEDLQSQTNPLILNLASQEYAKAVDFKKLNVKVITPDFKDAKNGRYQMISFFAKRARGLMASWVIRNRIENEEDLISFASEGYVYNPQLSTELKPVFTRG